MKQIHTHSAPAAIGPYSQAVAVNGLLFTSGQIAIDPATGEVVTGGIEAQTERICMNLKAVLEEAGTSLKRVVKTTCFLADMGDSFTRLIFERGGNYYKKDELYKQRQQNCKRAEIPPHCPVDAFQSFYFFKFFCRAVRLQTYTPNHAELL